MTSTDQIDIKHPFAFYPTVVNSTSTKVTIVFNFYNPKNLVLGNQARSRIRIKEPSLLRTSHTFTPLT